MEAECNMLYPIVGSEMREKPECLEDVSSAS